MVNNSTSINKLNNLLSPKESLNRDGQQFYQYQQTKQSPLILNLMNKDLLLWFELTGAKIKDLLLWFELTGAKIKDLLLWFELTGAKIKDLLH
jgi:hypothetical protein